MKTASPDYPVAFSFLQGFFAECYPFLDKVSIRQPVAPKVPKHFVEGQKGVARGEM